MTAFGQERTRRRQSGQSPDATLGRLGDGEQDLELCVGTNQEERLSSGDAEISSQLSRQPKKPRDREHQNGPASESRRLKLGADERAGSQLRAKVREIVPSRLETRQELVEK